jgi:glycosyltransferase involved in cell wall biosynthesis
VQGERRPRVLWLTDEPPDRRLGGGNIRQAHLVTGLARTCDVHLVIIGAAPDDEVAAAVGRVTLLDDPGLREPARPAVRTAMHVWLAVAGRGPREVALAGRRRRRLRTALRALEVDADVVVACHPGLAAALPTSRRARWVAQIHHVPSVQAVQEHRLATDRGRRWVRGREAAKARRFERWLVAAFDLVVVVSDADRRAIAAGAEGAPVVVVPNGVDTAAYPSTPLPPEPRVLMAGSFQYGPNVDGARWFCDEVLPLVRAAVPATELALVGRSPAAEVRALADRPGVQLHADVPTMRPWFEWSRATVVPLRVGAGTRLKALESMSAGRPVVGTAVGLLGLAVDDGVEALVADGPEGMADALVGVLLDDERAIALAAAGRRFVEAHHDWSAIGTAFADRIRDLADH